MKDPFTTHGKPSWLELLTTDPDAAKTFYSQLFGWSMQDMPMEGIIYTTLSVGEDPIGGIMAMPPEMGETPPHWGNYITVDNADDIAAKAEALGGRVLIPPRDIPSVGRFCLLQDPQGAVISAIAYVANHEDCEK